MPVGCADRQSSHPTGAQGISDVTAVDMADAIVDAHRSWRAPGFIGDVQAWIDDCAIYPAPLLSLGAAVACVATLCGRRYALPSGLRSALYVVGVAKSGVGKDVGRQCTANLLTAAKCQDRIGTDDIASAAGVVARLRKHPVAWFPLDEFGRLVEAYTSKNAGSHERMIVTTLMKMWSSTSGTYYGKAYAERDCQSVEMPHPVIYGTTTPDALYRALRGSDVVDGVLSRLLVLEVDHGQMPERVPTASSASPPAELVERAAKIARGRGEGNLASVEQADLRATPTVLPLSAAAEAASRRIGAGLRAKLDGAHAELWVRAREQSLRLALAVAVGCDADEVGVEHLAWSWRLVRWTTQRIVSSVAARVADTEEGRCALALLSAIDAAGGAPMTLAALSRAAWRWDRRVRTDSLASLLDSGQVVCECVTVGDRVVKAYRRPDSDPADEVFDATQQSTDTAMTTVGHVVDSGASAS